VQVISGLGALVSVIVFVLMARVLARPGPRPPNIPGWLGFNLGIALQGFGRILQGPESAVRNVGFALTFCSAMWLFVTHRRTVRLAPGANTTPGEPRT
jgi:hypothetical protein